jgi:hypothetical protein
MKFALVVTAVAVLIAWRGIALYNYVFHKEDL